jgi:hypothetical protein
MAKNPLQVCQHNSLIFLCLHVCHATWPKILVFCQARYRKFSGVCAWRAIIVSKSKEMVDLTMALFARFWVNGNQDELLSRLG